MIPRLPYDPCAVLFPHAPSKLEASYVGQNMIGAVAAYSPSRFSTSSPLLTSLRKRFPELRRQNLSLAF